jgi:hypothetical protein
VVIAVVARPPLRDAKPSVRDLVRAQIEADRATAKVKRNAISTEREAWMHKYFPGSQANGEIRDAAMTAWEEKFPEKMNRLLAAATAIQAENRPERIIEQQMEEYRRTMGEVEARHVWWRRSLRNPSAVDNQDRTTASQWNPGGLLRRDDLASVGEVVQFDPHPQPGTELGSFAGSLPAFMTPDNETMDFLTRPVEGLTNYVTLPEVQKARAVWDKHTLCAPWIGKDVRNKMLAAFTALEDGTPSGQRRAPRWR